MFFLWSPCNWITSPYSQCSTTVPLHANSLEMSRKVEQEWEVNSKELTMGCYLYVLYKYIRTSTSPTIPSQETRLITTDGSSGKNRPNPMTWRYGEMSWPVTFTWPQRISGIKAVYSLEESVWNVHCPLPTQDHSTQRFLSTSKYNVIILYFAVDPVSLCYIIFGIKPVAVIAMVNTYKHTFLKALTSFFLS